MAQLMATPQHTADRSTADTTRRCQGLGDDPDQPVALGPVAGEEAGASLVAERCPSPPARLAPTP